MTLINCRYFEKNMSYIDLNCHFVQFIICIEHDI